MAMDVLMHTAIMIAGAFAVAMVGYNFFFRR